MAKRRSNLKKYWTGLIIHTDKRCQLTFPLYGSGWTAVLATQRRTPHLVYKRKEIVLRASSWITAQRALDLIQSCLSLVVGYPPIGNIHLIAHNPTEPEWMDDAQRSTLFETYLDTADLPLACAIAAKASRRREWSYSVAKFKFSLSLFSVPPVDLEPWRAPHLPISLLPNDHITFAYAIISAFSVIEDLKLTLRASVKKPSRINGEWNPVVRTDLEERLKKAGVNLQEKFLWTVRGPKRKIEKRRAFPDGTKAPWSAWLVRDSDIPIIDAIAYAEWLRSCVASHGVKDLTSVLSPYDVINVQSLASRLLLEILGFWRWHQEKVD